MFTGGARSFHLAIDAHIQGTGENEVEIGVPLTLFDQLLARRKLNKFAALSKRFSKGCVTLDQSLHTQRVDQNRSAMGTLEPLFQTRHMGLLFRHQQC
jgi:hypothetical protein